MENSALRFCGEGLEETTVSMASPSAPPVESSASHTALEDCLPSLDATALGDSSGAVSSVEPKYEYFSTRVKSMMQTTSQFASPVEHAIAHAKAHWSEVAGTSGTPLEGKVQNNEAQNRTQSSLSDLSETSESSSNSSYNEGVDRENARVFAKLMKNPKWRRNYRPFFRKASSKDFQLGRKIAEGGQAEIYEIIFPEGTGIGDHVLKVFKRELRLSDLQQEWPSAILQRRVRTCLVHSGLLLEDGRFAFMMLRCPCDLRALIDKAMVEKNNQCPPFPFDWKEVTLTARDFMVGIAFQMINLHEKGILHRDLKAANILIHESEGFPGPIIADYECSLAVVGTRSWMAPEVLLALKEKEKVEFSKAMDVYSYAMTCFEVVTGRLPFEGEQTSYDLVIAGQRPTLPSDLEPALRDLIESCWHKNPESRPSFSKIVEILKS